MTNPRRWPKTVLVQCSAHSYFSRRLTTAVTSATKSSGMAGGVEESITLRHASAKMGSASSHLPALIRFRARMAADKRFSSETKGAESDLLVMILILYLREFLNLGQPPLRY